jgi:hypothetical protein
MVVAYYNNAYCLDIFAEEIIEKEKRMGEDIRFRARVSG